MGKEDDIGAKRNQACSEEYLILKATAPFSLVARGRGFHNNLDSTSALTLLSSSWGGGRDGRNLIMWSFFYKHLPPRVLGELGEPRTDCFFLPSRT